MAHDITITYPKQKLSSSDVKFLVKQDVDVLGTLKVSRGSLVRVPPNSQIGFKVDWADFAEYAVNKGTYGHR